MARNYARFITEVWFDDEWRALGQAQHLYLCLISQPRITLAGVLDLKPRLWASMTGMTVDLVDDCLAVLVEADKVAIDEETGELVVRTFVKHDKVLGNSNLAKGMWSAWAQIESPALRAIVLENLPDEAFDDALKPRAPKPEKPPSEPPFEPRLLEAGNDGFSSRNRAPETSPPPPPPPPLCGDTCTTDSFVGSESVADDDHDTSLLRVTRITRRLSPDVRLPGDPAVMVGDAVRATPGASDDEIIASLAARWPA